MTEAFATFSDQDVRDLVAEYPLAWVVASDPGVSSLLPLLGEYDADGKLLRLFSHMSRRNPLFEKLTNDPKATVLINGPHAYVGPDHAGLRDWGPTWNYAQLVITVDVIFEPEETGHALRELVAFMEGDRWTAKELGARYTGMADAVIAFRAHVTGLTGRFKLGQDERPEVFASIVRSHPDPDLVRWMKRFDR